MSNIGKLKRAKDDDGEFLLGSIRTLEFNLNIRLYPTGEPADSRSPSHRVYATRKDGSEVEIGAAWTKTMTHPDKFGEEFLSITIDDPSLPQPLNVAAFKDAEGDTWTITFRRRQAKSA